MGIKKYNPTTPSLRQMTFVTPLHLRSLTRSLLKNRCFVRFIVKRDVTRTVELLLDTVAVVLKENTELLTLRETRTEWKLPFCQLNMIRTDQQTSLCSSMRMV